MDETLPGFDEASVFRALADPTRRRILDVARAMFAERGYESTTNRLLGAEADLTAGAIYHHFGTKADLYRLFRNLGKQSDGSVRFLDATVSSGIAKLPGPGLGALCADFDGDGWPDIFCADDVAE